MSESSSFVQFPSGVTYNSGTRTVSVDWSADTGNAGRVYCTVVTYDTNGSICEPAKFSINRGPSLVDVPTDLVVIKDSNYEYDIYRVS